MKIQLRYILFLFTLFIMSCEEEAQDVHGCLDSQSCNYNSSATIDNNSCWYAEDDCECSNGQNASADMCGVCDTDETNNCVQDECGIWGGEGPTSECGCEDIPEGACNCDGDILDDCGECGGSGPEENFNCEGNCIIDIDCNEECGGNAFLDDCFDCVGGNTGLSACIITKLYVCDQSGDAVYVYDPLTLDLLNTIPINFGGDEEEGIEFPHFVDIDEVNGYWFVTTSQSGYVGMYDLEEDTLIHSIEVGDSPAMLAVDDETQTLFVSRMMSMMPGMNPEPKLDRLDYSGGSLVQEEQVCLAPTEDFLDFPNPHAISFSNETSRPGGTLMSASFTSDWISRTDMYSSGGTQTIHQSLHGDNQAWPDVEVNQLFPLAVAQKDDYAFFSCSGSSAADVSGQVQSWVVGDMADPSLKSVYEFDSSSMLWHIVESPIESQVFVVLSSGEEGFGGVACLSYDEGEEFTDLDGNGMYDEGEEFADTGNGTYDSEGTLKLVWQTTSPSFDTLHGITVSADGSHLYISSRGDGSVHVLDAITGELLNSELTGGMMLGGMAITQFE